MSGGTCWALARPTFHRWGWGGVGWGGWGGVGWGGVVTTVRALMTELGWAMHAASLVEVVLDPETDEDQGEETGLLQVEAVSFVQQVVTRAYSILQKLQAELEGPSLGLARLRAKRLRKKLRKLRSDTPLGDPELADRVDALCVVVEEAGSGHSHDGFLALDEQVETWTWHWMSQLEPMWEPVRERARGSGEPCSVISVTQSDVNPAELALGSWTRRRRSSKRRRASTTRRRNGRCKSTYSPRRPKGTRRGRTGPCLTRCGVEMVLAEGASGSFWR